MFLDPRLVCFEQPIAALKFNFMLYNNEKAPVNSESVKEGGVVLIVSHDLDQHTMLPLSLKRDFGIKSMRHWFIQDDLKPNKDAYAGVQFSEFMGRKVKGFFAPVSSVLASGVLEVETLRDLRSLTIVQLVPEFHGYKAMCKVMGKIYNLPDLEAKGFMPDEALAQELSEQFLLNVIGICFGLPNSPFADDGRSGTVQEKIRASKALLHADRVWKFFNENQISYALCKVGDNFIGLGRGTKNTTA